MQGGARRGVPSWSSFGETTIFVTTFPRGGNHATIFSLVLRRRTGAHVEQDLVDGARPARVEVEEEGRPHTQQRRAHGGHTLRGDAAHLVSAVSTVSMVSIASTVSIVSSVGIAATRYEARRHGRG